jgi:hypothetical protein
MHTLALAQRAAIQPGETHEQRHSFVPRIGNSIAQVQAESVVTKPSIAPPRITAGFAASHDLGGSPSDAAGAVSNKYLLHASNASILTQDRAGAILSNITLASFWHDPAYVDGSLYDSRVLYDAVADRWILCTLYDVGLSKSTLLIAVSDGGNPSLGWHRYRFVVDPDDVLEADYTRMAMTRDSIVVTSNIFSGPSEFADVFIIRKNDAYAGAPTLPISQTQANGFDLVPVDDREDALPYLILQSGTADLSIYSFKGGSLTSVGNANAPALNFQNLSFAPIGLQLGSNFKMDCGDLFLGNALLRNGTLWVVTQTLRDSPVRSLILWWRIAMSTPLRVDTGIIEDATGASMYAFPSIAVNGFGAALIGYAVFNASIYPGAGYSYISPSNNLSTPALLKVGDAVSRRSRWGDFSTTIVDANDADFWTIQTYSAANGLWATWWSKVDMPPSRRRAALH